MAHDPTAARPRHKRRGGNTPFATAAHEVASQSALQVNSPLPDTLIDAMIDAVAIFDADGRLVRSNAAMQTLLGLPTDPAVGAMLPAERARRMKSRSLDGRPLSPESLGIARLLQGEVLTNADPLELRLTTLDGREVAISITGAPLRDSSGQIAGAVATLRDETERWKLEEQLRFQASMLERSHDAIFLWELGGPIVYWNHGAELLYGYTAEEAVGHNSHELLLTTLPEPGPIFDAHLRETGEWTGELTHTARDGRKIDVLSRLQTQPGEMTAGDARIYVAQTAQDITEHRKLEEQQRFQASMLDRAHDAIFLWEMGGPITYWNHGAELLYGYTAAEAVGRRSHDLLHTKHPEPVDDFERHLLQSGEWSGELTHVTRAGTTVEVLSQQQVLHGKGGDGKPHTYVFETARDITERKQMERRTRQALEALLAMARTLVERPEQPTSGSGAHESARHSTRTVAQHLAELTRDVLGCQRVGLMAVDPETLEQRALAVVGLAPAQEAQWWAEVEQLPRYGEGADPEILARFAAGDSLVIDMTEPPYDTLPNPYGITTSLFIPLLLSGAVVGILSLDHGGARHEYTPDERALADAVGQLAVVAIERERLIEERAAAEARELAQREANQHISQFLSTINHELKTPVTVLAANLGILERRLHRMQAAAESAGADPALPKGMRDAQTLVAQGQSGVMRLNRLVDDLLDASRIRAGKFEVREEECDLGEIVRATIEEQRQVHPARTLSLTVPPGARIPLRADPVRIGQVLTNYLTNALKYSEEHEPVHVEVAIEESVARVAVRDHGPGLDPAQQERIWDAFHRAEGIAVLTGSGVGLGLGLHICKTIIDRHHGRLGVKSAVGDGSTFWFSLPMIPA